MQWWLLHRYFEEFWEARWVIAVLQLMMVSAILVIGAAINMIVKRTWLEDASFAHPIEAKEGSLCTGNGHSSR